VATNNGARDSNPAPPNRTGGYFELKKSVASPAPPAGKPQASTPPPPPTPKK